MKTNAALLPLILTLAAPICALAHDSGAAHGDPRFSARNFSAQPPMEMLEILRDGKGIPAADSDAIKALTARYLSRRSNRPADAGSSAPSAFTRRQAESATAAATAAPQWQFVTTPFNPLDAFIDVPFTLTSYTAPAGNGALMAASFAPFKPHVRYDWDGAFLYLQGDGVPDRTLMPNPMVGITSWQQHIPLPISYFAGTTNPESSSLSLGYKKPNVWTLPLIPTPSASPIAITASSFTRGAVAIAANGIAIFNPHNNTGALSYEKGELDTYGGHCGKADDYHYHIIPTHLSSIFGGPLGNDVPVAWSLDGYPYYGFLEPDGTAQQPLDSSGGHSHGSYGYHYHATGNTTVDATHPYGTPQSPYAQTAFHGTVVYYGSQVDGQPEVGSIRNSPSGGFADSPVSGTVLVTAFKNPVALSTDGSGNLSENIGGTASADSYLMRVSINATTYDQCWKINRSTYPQTLTITWRLPSGTNGVSTFPVTTTYANADNRLTPYPTAAWSETKLPDTSQTLNVSTAPPYQDSNYNINPQSFTDNGNGTITDNVTGLMWQKVDNGESTWANGVANAPGISTGGYSDWRLPTPAELFSIQNHNNTQPALNPIYFTSAPLTLSNCTWITTSNITTVTCTSTAQLSTAVAVTGAGIPAGAKVSSVTNSTTFVLSSNAGTNSTPVTLTAQGGDYWWTTDPYFGSTTLTWCVNAGGGAGPKALTQTLSAGGSFRYCARYVRGKSPTNGHNYVNNNDGTITDTDTSLMWTQVPFAAASWNSALSTAAGTTRGGYGDWRLPNIKELETMTDHTLTSATSATGILPCIDRTMFTATLTGCSTNVGSPTITCASTTGLLVGMPLVDYIDAAGTYFSAVTPPTILSISNDGVTFTMSSNATATGSGLTFKALAPPTAYWSSSVVSAGTLTQAWLLETGINSSVPAGSGPTRNQQGIISYEIFASTYPFFAVRNTSVTTQIAVSQGGTALTDAVSTVAYGNVNVGSTSSKTFTISNTGVSALTISGVTIDGTNASNFTVTTSPATTIAAGGSTTMDVVFSAASAGAKVATIHIASSDTSVGAAFDITLSGTGYIPPPTIANTLTSPNTPTYVDGVWVTAQLAAASGASITSAQLTFSNGAQTTTTVFNETMATVATSGTGAWDQATSPATYAWTLTNLDGAGNIKQTAGTSNHSTASGSCGLVLGKGSAASTDPTRTMVTLTNAINATGTFSSGSTTTNYVEFWVRSVGLTGTNGWSFQLAPNGTTFTERRSEFTGSIHGYQLYHYDLLATDLTATLKMQFGFVGNGVGGGSGSAVNIDDITVVRTTGNPPTVVTMYDDGAHGDGLAGDGIFGAAIPVQTAGTTVSYSLSVTDSNGSTTTSSASGTYTVSAITPPASFSAAASRTGSNVTITWPSQSGIGYSVQWSADLIHWSNIPVGQTNTWTDTTAGSVLRRFYRVMR